MREDLNKQLCERERRGSRYMKFRRVRHAKKFASKDPEEASDVRAHESMTLRYGYDDKAFSENLAPLRGAVRKALGRPYAKFYSDLSKVFDKRSVINQHILGHLKDFLAHDNLYQRADGELMVARRYLGPDLPLREVGSIEFYVDPRDGIIKRNKAGAEFDRRREKKRDAERQREIDARFRELPDGTELHLIDGNWFQVEVLVAPIGYFVYEKPAGQELFAPFKSWAHKPWHRLADWERRKCGVKRFVGAAARDILSGKSVFCEPGGVLKRYRASKRSASKRVLKAAGIVAR